VRLWALKPPDERKRVDDDEHACDLAHVLSAESPARLRGEVSEMGRTDQRHGVPGRGWLGW